MACVLLSLPPLADKPRTDSHPTRSEYCLVMLGNRKTAGASPPAPSSLLPHDQLAHLLPPCTQTRSPLSCPTSSAATRSTRRSSPGSSTRSRSTTPIPPHPHPLPPRRPSRPVPPPRRRATAARTASRLARPVPSAAAATCSATPCRASSAARQSSTAQETVRVSVRASMRRRARGQVRWAAARACSSAPAATTRSSRPVLAAR